MALGTAGRGPHQRRRFDRGSRRVAVLVATGTVLALLWPGATGAAVPPSATPVTAEEDRRGLVAAIIEASDVVSSEAIRTTLAGRLEAVGVETIDVAPGTAFDPATHRGVHAEPAPAPEQDATVAHTDRPGWRDRGIVLRPPEVVVYRWQAT